MVASQPEERTGNDIVSCNGEGTHQIIDGIVSKL